MHNALKEIRPATANVPLISPIKLQGEGALSYEIVCNFWKPNQDAYIGLGKMYVEDPRFAQNYESLASGCAEFMCRAMKIYAQEHLSN